MTLFNDDAQHQYTDEELAQVIAESKLPEEYTENAENPAWPGDDTTTQDDGPSWLEKIDYLYESAVKIRELIDKLSPEDIERTQRTMANPLVKKLMGLK